MGFTRAIPGYTDALTRRIRRSKLFIRTPAFTFITRFWRQPNGRRTRRMEQVIFVSNQICFSVPTRPRTCITIQDPFGNSYGYSTIQAATPDTTKGYNPHSICGAPVAERQREATADRTVD